MGSVFAEVFLRAGERQSDRICMQFLHVSCTCVAKHPKACRTPEIESGMMIS